jgi:hypothetical protein
MRRALEKTRVLTRLKAGKTIKIKMQFGVAVLMIGIARQQL